MAMTSTERFYKWREKNLEHSREYQRLYARKRRQNPTIRAQQAAALRERYARDPDYWRQRSRKWARDNPEQAAANARRRRARMLGAPGSFSADDFRALCEESGGTCAYCGRGNVKLAADHVVPLSRGGSNDIANIAPACKSCNSSKYTRTGAEFRELSNGSQLRS